MFLKKQKLIYPKIILTTVIIFLAFVFSSEKVDAYSCSWKNGAGSTAWTTAANWDSCNSTYPQTTDDVTINIATANQPILDLSGGNVTINSLSIGSSAASTLTLSNGFTNQLIITGNLTVGGSGTITHTANTTASTHAIRLSVGGDMSIANGGYVNANGKGLSGGAGGTSGHVAGYDGNTSGSGGGTGGTAGSGGGGGYGGAGRSGDSGVGGIENDQANIHQPTALGSGGGGGSYTGGAGPQAGGSGGGAIKLSVAGTFTLSFGGFVTANGNAGGSNSDNNEGGGGSGGSIWISSGTITGSGTIQSGGGAGGTYSSTYYGGGGSGGRISLTYTTDSSSSFTKTTYGAIGYGNGYAASGSIYTKQDSATYGDLTFNNNGHNSPSARTISSTYGVKNFNNLNFLEGTAGFTISASAEFNIYGQITASSANTFSTAFTNSGTFSQNSATYTSLTFASTFTNSGGTTTLPSLTTLTFSSTNSNTGTITANALTTLNFNGGTSTDSGTFTANSLQNFNITGATVTMDTLYSDGTSRYILPSTYAMTISSSGTLTHTTNANLGSTSTYYLNLSMANLTIDGTSKIDVSGFGLGGGAGGTNGHTTGYNGETSGAGGGSGGLGSGAGGGHGGAGGNSDGGATGGVQHGQASLTQPTDLGSGGGGGAYSLPTNGLAGGNGGGAIKLVVSGTLTLNSGGFITANGNAGGSNSQGNEGGGGSGGSIWISAGAITGSGTVRANGGVGGTFSGTYYGGGGAGGRISLTFAKISGYNLTNTATGAIGYGNGYGSNGSIYYNVSASYTSSVVDFALGRNFTTLGYNKTTTADSISTPSLTVDARAGNTATPDGTWTGWSTGLANSASLDAFDNYRYIQYRVNLASNNSIQSPKPYNAPTANPLLSDISFNYINYPGGYDFGSFSDWLKRKSITIDHAKVGATLTNFPVYVNLADLGANFFSAVKSDGADIRITNSSGTELPYELVSIDANANTGELYFKADSLSSGTNTSFYIYYGNSSASAYAASDPYGRNNVWTNGYVMVQHMKDTTTSTTSDSTSNGNNGSKTSANNPNEVDGKLGKAQDFASKKITVSDSDSLTGTDGLSVSFWANDDSPANNYLTAISKYNNAEDQTAEFDIVNTLNSKYNFYVRNTSWSNVGSLTSIPSQTWTLWTFTYNNNSGALKVYFNGSIDNSANGTAGLLRNTTAPLYIGYRPGIEYYDGRLDEVKVYNGELSSGWISTEYNNQNYSTTFYSVGNVQTQTPYITSSTYNSNDSANTLAQLVWNETVPSNTNIRFQMQTSSNGTDWSEFMGPDGETN
ncbi:MAG TPA: DUF2341 domain-containing protein, partial [Candidatus Moranbacteria bacterium]|nr:DUF2341 domain-containing protein [Candidatus Moranbacteria bacterium]